MSKNNNFFIFIAFLLVVILGVTYFILEKSANNNQNINSISLITYNDDVYHYSFSLPNTISPIPKIFHTFPPIQGSSEFKTTKITDGFMQFTVASYLSEGVEMIPSIQVNVQENKEFFSFPANPLTNLSLLDFVKANEIRSFRGEIKQNTNIVNGTEQILICEKQIPANCFFYLLSSDKKYVIQGSLNYPLQGPRSLNKDITLEESFEQMRRSIKLF